MSKPEHSLNWEPLFVFIVGVSLGILLGFILGIVMSAAVMAQMDWTPVL